ncbi:MAG: hypothetical protein EA349_05180 [Halomonadaceae bacterium]|nr:MAG: hypothetical protein EA349_05180 [Halomonadaceae bacterium]
MDKSWLMTPQVIANVKQIRRRISSEFGAELHLTDHDLYDKLAHYASCSRDTMIINLWAELQLRLAPAEEEPAARRVYRGQVVDEPEAEPGSLGTNKPTEEVAKAKGTRVYRGQRSIAS